MASQRDFFRYRPRRPQQRTFEGNPFQLDEWSTDVCIQRADGWRRAITHVTS